MSEQNDLMSIWKQSQSAPQEGAEQPTEAFEESGEFSPSPLEELEQRIAAEGGDIQEDAGGTAGELSDLDDSEESDSESLLNKLDSEAKPETTSDIEFIKVTDETGRKRKVKIDYTDRKSIANAFKQAAGMRKFQAERDKVKTEFADIQGKYQELNDVYGKLNSAWEEGGVKAVVNLLGGSEDAWEKAVAEDAAHKAYLENLTPNEKIKLEMEERERKYQSQLEAERKQRELFESKIAEKEEQAALQSLESKLYPAFDRYRFAGKLGDEVIEHQFDEAIWDKVSRRLAEYPDDVELTQAIVDKEFRTVANNFRKMVNIQTEKKVQKTIENKKVDASQRAQVAAKKGLKTTGSAQQFVSDIKGGNLASAFNALMNGKVKL